MKTTEIPSVRKAEDFETLEATKVALVDIEGTLTPGKRKVPENPQPEHYRKVLDGKKVEGSQEVGYWSGLHLLNGETPSEYFARVEDWWDGETELEEFESKNVAMWNELLEESSHKSARKLIEWYNDKFLNLRSKADELIRILKEKGYNVGIISHTSESLSKKVVENTEADFVVPAWRFSFEDGKFAFTEKEVYADEKSEIIDELEEGGTEEILFVGNGKNDVNIANRSDKAYMVENKDEVDYEEVDAFTGSFDEIIDRLRKDLQEANAR